MFGALLLVAVCATFSERAGAWGWDAHRLIAEIAWSQMTPETRSQVRQLIGDDFVESSVWPDLIVRERRATAPWHYVNFPANATSYDPERDCKNDNCAVAQVLKFSRILADRQLINSIRAEALKFLIHFVQDIHQPLHAAYASDRGGNQLWVRIDGLTERLHGWWDYGLLERYWGKDRAAAIEECLTVEIKPSWLHSTPTDWANESFAITRQLYHNISGANTKDTPIILPDSYVNEARPIIRERLMMAAVRLAHIMNASLEARKQ